MNEKEQKFELICDLIHSAIESEQDEPKLFNDETEKRLNHVYVVLNEILGITE
tara:strand:- start:102 stop:260 length:159 start_codon:yes stop_codon:yes gene_type:complete